MSACKVESQGVCFRHSWIQGQGDGRSGLLSFSSVLVYTQAGAFHVVVLAAPSRIPPSIHPMIHPEERGLLPKHF